MPGEFKRVGEDFKLHDEVLVVVNDIEEGAGGDPDPVALVFYRNSTNPGHVEEYGPNAVEDALAFATAQAAGGNRQVVVQLPEGVTWWPHWGTLVD